jgi:hypothetical protein
MTIELLERNGCILTNCHCIEPSNRPGLGDHVDIYVSGDFSLHTPSDTKQLAISTMQLTTRFRSKKTAVIVAVPSTKDLGEEIAKQLDLHFEWLEVNNGSLRPRDGFEDAVVGKLVMVVLGVVRNEEIVKQVMTIVRRNGGKTVAVCCVWQDMTRPARLEVPLFGLMQQASKRWTPRQCQIDGPCSQGQPINRLPGDGAVLERLIKTGRVRIPANAKITFV